MIFKALLYLVAVIPITTLALGGCRDNGSEVIPAKQGIREKKEKLSPLAQLAPMDVPVDEFSGAYKVCLRSNDYMVWSQRIQLFKDRSVQSILEEYGVPQTSSSLSGLITESLSEALAPVAFGVGLAARANKLLNDIASGSSSQVSRNPLCGNWCGPGHPILSGRVENLDIPVTDPVDRVCKLHDICYIKYGFQSCRCDQMLLNMLAHDRDFTTINPAELAMITYFQSSTCSGGCKKFGNIKVCGRTTF